MGAIIFGLLITTTFINNDLPFWICVRVIHIMRGSGLVLRQGSLESLLYSVCTYNFNAEGLCVYSLER